jgi:Fic family protein
MRTIVRAIVRTHPWISFSLDLRRTLPATWLALGEARSKCEHLAGVPLRPAIAERLHEIYLAKGIHATAAIEGNTLTEGQVLQRIQGKRDLPQSQEYLGREVDNIVDAANRIIGRISKKGFSPISVDDLKDYNRRILKDLEVEDHVRPGEYRDIDVGVMDYKAPHPKECETLVERFCQWLNGTDFKPPHRDDTITYGIIKAIVAHVYFAWIHPFGDGNGRTARLLEVRFLMEAGVPTAAVHLLSNHYSNTRMDYYRRLSETSKNDGDLNGFIFYAVRGLVDQLRKQLRFVKFQQWGLAWESYIHEALGTKRTNTARRQHVLLLALSDSTEPVPKGEIKHLNPKLAEMYATKTPKTLSRDLNELMSKNLISIEGETIRANKEIILAFLPGARAEDRDAQREESKRLTHERDQLGFDF